jgi:hypothetical protein
MPVRGRPPARFAICVCNDGYPAALEVRKVYRVLNDESAAERRLTRIVDESGEDYLYPRDWFVPIEVPRGARSAFAESVSANS